jgi:transcriptional regulator with XRE-family HTH domain
VADAKAVQEPTRSRRAADALSSEEAPALEVMTADKIRAIGAEIRNLRRQRRLSLRHLSARSGLSIGFLSLVERGRSTLALTSLYAVASALETDVAHFFPPKELEERPHPLPHVSRAGGEFETTISSSKRLYRMLSPRAPGKVLEPLLVTIQPTDNDVEPYGHEGEEFCYVLKGELVYAIEGREHRLGPGDSIHVKSSVPHAIRNDSGDAVEALWVLTPPILGS